MKKWIAVICALLICAALFFPVSTVHTISGNGEVLTTEKEKVGDCELSVEIKEVRSLVTCYSRRFTFTLDGRTFAEFESNAGSETDDGLCLLSQMFYDAEKDSMELCSLVYQKDFSYALLRLDDHLYFADNGSGLAYTELPVA